MCKCGVNCEQTAAEITALKQEIADMKAELLMMKMAVVGIFEIVQDPNDDESKLDAPAAGEAS